MGSLRFCFIGSWENMPDCERSGRLGANCMEIGG